MKKVLIFIILGIFYKQNNAFATIQQTAFLGAKSDTIGQECVKISLKNGNIVYGNISKIGDTQLFFKQCDQPIASITSISIKEVSEITDVHGKIINHKPPKIISAKREKIGAFLANVSLGTMLLSWGLRYLAESETYTITPLKAPPYEEYSYIGRFLIQLFGALSMLAFIIGILSLVFLNGSKKKWAKIKAWLVILPTIILLIAALSYL